MYLISRKLVLFLIIFYNIPAFIFNSDIVNAWLLFLPLFIFKNKYSSKVFIQSLIIIFFIFIWSFSSFSFKYVIIFLLPFLLQNFRREIIHMHFIVKCMAIFTFFFSFLYLFDITNLNPFLSYFFGNDGVETSGTRGRPFFSTEPSHLAVYSILLFDYIINTKNTKSRLYTIPTCIILIVIGGSGTLILYGSIYFVVWLLSKNYVHNLRKKYIVLTIGILIIFFGLLPSRIYELLVTSIEMLSNNEFSIQNTASLASGRFIANYLWISSIFHEPLGFGFGLQREQIFYLADIYHIDLEKIGAFSLRGYSGIPVMPRSYFSCLVGIFGLFSIPILIMIFRNYLTEKIIFNKPLFFTAIFYIFIVGFAGSPFPWIAILMSTKKKNDIYSN